jgi:hypothetical protein
MCCSSCSLSFCDKEYNTPRTFRLADYSVVFHDSCHRLRLDGFSAYPQTIQTAYELLGATLRTNTLPFLIPTNRVCVYRGCCAALRELEFPSKTARKLTLFPIPLRHHYLTRCSRIRLPFRSEQACFCLRLTTAEVCDLSSCSVLAYILASTK